MEASSYRVLDPKASPYNKIPPTHFFVYVFPHPPVFNHELPLVIASPLFSTYNIRFQPSVRISLPLSLSSQSSRWSEKTNVNISPTPVPSGPRTQKSRLPGRRRRITTVVGCRKSGKGGDGMKWQPKVLDISKAIENGSEKAEKTRWKNRRGEYESFLPLETKTTSVMIKNIPNKYTRELLIQTLDHHCETENKKLNNGGSVGEDEIMSAYDFLYLPIDFHRRLNAGFAFVNFTNPEAAFRFRNAFHGKHWEFFNSPKIAEISRAKIQGKVALINHCKGMDFTYGSKRDMPVWFEPARNGSGGIHSKMRIVGKTHLKTWF